MKTICKLVLVRWESDRVADVLVFEAGVPRLNCGHALQRGRSMEEKVLRMT